LHTAGGAQVGFGLAARKKAPIIINVECLLERDQEQESEEVERCDEPDEET
jgi:hypothetical protein